MAKAMTKSKIIAAVAEKAGISKKQTALVLETLAQMAYKEAKNGFTFHSAGAQARRPHGPQPADRRGHQDPGAQAAQVRRCEGRQGRRPLGAARASAFEPK